MARPGGVTSPPKSGRWGPTTTPRAPKTGASITDTWWFGGLAALADFLGLTLRIFRSLFTRRLDWTKELFDQCVIIARRCAWPVALSAAGLATPVYILNVGELTRTLGGVDRLGGAVALASMREVGSWVTGMLVAGIAGTAICSDLGSRKVREEIDALSVLAVDLTRTLILPRVLAVTIMMPLMWLWAVLWCTLPVFILAPTALHFPAASFIKTYQTVPLIDLWIGLLKLTVIGLLVGLVCCYKGLTAKGGPAGVGRAVNQAVVLAFLCTWIVSILMNAFFQAAFSQTQNVR
jgi:phospholipid/cholesterol/gamma-HCH transport system permease protein